MKFVSAFMLGPPLTLLNGSWQPSAGHEALTAAATEPVSY